MFVNIVVTGAVQELLPVADHLARKYKLESTVVNKDEFISQFC